VPALALDPTPHAYPGAAVQFEHELAPAALNVPIPHAPEQDDDDVADDAPNRPAGQSRHATSPASEYFPTPHAAAAGVALVEPDGHAYPPLQFEHDATPPLENVPPLQGPEHVGVVRPSVAPK
jgi:hypothetical protein